MAHMARNTSSAIPREFAEPLHRREAELGPFASRISWHAETGSTNADAVALAEAGADEGAVVVADMQTAGRGRLGRTWSSPPGVGLYASVLLRPDASIAGLLSLATGVAIAEAIEFVSGLAPSLKWPNDVYLGSGGAGRKVAGILAEGGMWRGQTWVVVGFGINVLPASLPPELATRATSIESELGRPIERGELLAVCLARLAARYEDLRELRQDDVLAEWRRRAAATFGRAVEWEDAGGRQAGVARGLDDHGALVVETTGGRVRIVSGEVRWI